MQVLERQNGDDGCGEAVIRKRSAESAEAAAAETAVHGVLVETGRRSHVPVQLLREHFSAGVRHGMIERKIHSWQTPELCSGVAMY